ncbi:hypothetical protein [Streptomyces sp. NBC_00996]|uniref:hypothetical protein n=1 Tax=Streptomyces sp. NBC_00996 TaxID=2903710 RepID=UPI0038690D1A|nr:hypothetical protein OG390_14350 [Streptomyces sp. NBC_00996]
MSGSRLTPAAIGKDYDLKGIVGGQPVNSDTVTAIAATAIALGSLWTSYAQTRATRVHNRQSVRPLLQLRHTKKYDDHKAGLRVVNAGLGPAIVTNTVVRLDGVEIGQWNIQTIDRITAPLPVWPKTYTLRAGAVVLAGQSTFLFYLEHFSEDEHDWFWDLVARRLVVEVTYESLYGGENFKAVPPRS